MNARSNPSVMDEHVLAALLSGALSEKERASVLAHLATDPSARMLLSMAIEALEAAEDVRGEEAEDQSDGRRAA